MKHVNLRDSRSHFKPILQSRSVQAAVMTLKPGESSSDRMENEHPRAEQWLFVTSGTGEAKVDRRRLRVRAGTLLLIPKGAPHQVSNTGRVRLVTLNFYSPPAYTRAGRVKPSVARAR